VEEFSEWTIKLWCKAISCNGYKRCQREERLQIESNLDEMLSSISFPIHKKEN
jgi:hypothetical protein